LTYIAWSYYGTRGALRFFLWEQGAPPSLADRLPASGVVPYFAVQVGLGGLVYYLGDTGRVPTLVWLALLPPVAYSVFLLEWRGITAVSGLVLAVFVLNLVRWHGWRSVPYGLLAFSFGLGFTLVFTLLVVSSEKARWEVQRLVNELAEANRKLREYAVQIEELAATRERNRLAREIHDSLGHYLTVVNVQIEAARALHERDPSGAREALLKAQAHTQEGLREIRRSVAALRASPLDSRLLGEALQEVVADSRAAGLMAELQVVGHPRPLSPPAELTLYRAGQEGLTNVRKHAGTAQAHLVLDFSQPGSVRLTVTDEGMGVSTETSSEVGFGLLGLRERAQLLGGTVRTHSTPGAGFKLDVEVPG
jgi:signal transduction histidine kinase